MGHEMLRCAQHDSAVTHTNAWINVFMCIIAPKSGGEATVPKITIAQNILAANDTIAQDIQQLLVSREIRTINLMSSPGAGKTTLLERTIELLRGKLDIGVIEGDIETGTDAERIEAAGAETVQILSLIHI